MLRPYQERAIGMLRDSIRGGKHRPLMVLPCGSGKSVIYAQVIKSVADNKKKILWLVHRRNLVYQMLGILKEHFGIQASVIMAGVKPDLDNPIQLCTLQTYSRRLNIDAIAFNKFFVDADVVLHDEAHRSISKTSQNILKLYKDKIIMGCTATPVRADGRGLGEVYNNILDIAGIKELTGGGYLAPARYFVPVSIDLDGVKVSMGDYVAKQLDERVNKSRLIGDIVENWLAHGENRKTLVFCVNVRHSIAVMEAFQRAGVPAGHLDARSSDEERDEMFARMERGDITVLCNVAVYQEGLDVPDISCIIMARPSKSLGLVRQCLGRGLRPSNGKRDCIFFDHGGVIYEHGLLTDEIAWSLDGTKQAWAKKAPPKERAPVKCRVCHLVFEGSRVCPDCGTPCKTFSKDVDTLEAELAEVNEMVKKTSADKRRYLGMLKFWVDQKGHNPKMVIAKYKTRYGVWPGNGIRDVEPIPPDQAFLNLMRHDFIKWAKRKEG